MDKTIDFIIERKRHEMINARMALANATNEFNYAKNTRQFWLQVEDMLGEKNMMIIYTTYSFSKQGVIDFINNQMTAFPDKCDWQKILDRVNELSEQTNDNIRFDALTNKIYHTEILERTRQVINDPDDKSIENYISYMASQSFNKKTNIQNTPPYFFGYDIHEHIKQIILDAKDSTAEDIKNHVINYIQETTNMYFPVIENEVTQA